jgi:hypothetical protein
VKANNSIDFTCENLQIVLQRKKTALAGRKMIFLGSSFGMWAKS